jgi:nucleotide-binding universal stress UspA family protein
MYKRILVPIDDGACSELILKHSLELAGLCQAELTFLHVLATQDDEAKRQRTEEVLMQAKARAIEAGLSAKTQLVVAGHPVAAILQIEADYDLIIIATHGRQGADRLVLGSVSEGLIRQSQKPHLVLRCEDAAPFDLIDFYRKTGAAEEL